MDPLIIGGIIAGVSAIGSAIYNGISSSKAADKANAQSVALMREQNAFNAQMMREQNQYNSYSAQVQRAQEAGLNPSFLFQSGGTSQAAAPATGAAIPEIRESNFGSSFIDQLYKNTSLMKDIEKNKADIDKTRAETDSIKTANEGLKSRLDATLDEIRSNSAYNDAKRKEAEQNCKVAVAHEQELYKNIESISQAIELDKTKQKALIAEIEREDKRVEAEVNRWAHQNHVDDVQARVLSRSIIKLNNEIQLQIKEGRAMDAAWLSQTLDNAVKVSSTEADLRDYELRLYDPSYDYLVRYMSGELGNLAHVMNGGITSVRDNEKASSEAKRKLNNFFQGQTSWQNAH